MRIIELYAEEFGCFEGRRFSFEAGLNLIEGANESGKSTLQALIRFLFYGFPRRGGEEGEERYRRVSRKTHRAAGSVTFLWHGNTYLLYRDYILHGSGGREIPAETVCVTEIESGKRIDLGGKSPGEYFLSLPVELYLGSVCVRESQLSSVANPETGDTVAEMLFFGEGGAGLEGAEKILEQARRTLQHTRGNGGRIAALEEEAEALDRALESASDTRERLRVLRNDIARLTVQAQDKSRELKRTEEMQRAAQLDTELARFDAWHAAQNEADKQYHAWREEEQRGAAAKAEPSTQVLSEARELTSRCLLATEEVALREDAYMRCKQEASRYAQTATARYISESGGAEVVSARMERFRKKSRICVAFLVLFAFLSACFAVGAFVWREHLVMLISAGAISLVAMMIFGILHRRTRRARRIMYAAMGVRSPAMLRTVLARFESEEAMRAAAEHACINAEEIYHAAMERARTLFNQLKAVLVDVGAPLELATDPVAAREYLDAAAQRQASDTTHMEARLRFENAKSAAQALENGLDPTKEAELRALRVTLETPDADAARLEQRRAFLQETARGIADKLAAAEREEITLMARAADPAVLLAQKNEITEALFAARNRLAAIKMASEALREADVTLRGSVMPTLAEKASALFERLTGGAWKRLHVSDRFAISVETPQGSVPLSHFSAGCRDAAYFSLRVALTGIMTSEPLPLLLDEVTARLDDARAAQLLLLLRELCAAGEQCMLFTCHTRERMLLQGEKYAHILL